MLGVLASVALAQDAPVSSGEESPTQAAPQEASATVTGQLLERGSGRPLVGATVQLGDNAVTTDEEGRFRISGPAGTWVLKAAGPDHREEAFEELLLEGELLEVTYRLERYSWEKEVIVYGEPLREEVSRQVLSAEELRRIPGAFGDPIRALQSLPSVARPTGLEGDIVIRGAEGLNTGTFIDEVRVPFLFHLIGGRSVVTPDLLDDIEFYPGGMPSRFGDVTSGIVNARTEAGPAKDGFHGRMHVDLWEVGGSFELDLNDGWVLRGGGRQGWISSMIAASAHIYRWAAGRNDPSFKPALPRIPYNDGQLRLERTDGFHRYSLSLLHASDGLGIKPEWYDEDGDGLADPPPTPEELAFDYNTLVINRFQRITARHDFDNEQGRKIASWVSVGSDMQHSHFTGLGVLGSYIESGRIQTSWYRARHEQRLPLEGPWTLRFGGDVRVQPSEVVSYLDAASVEDLKTTRDTRTWVSPFVEAQWEKNRTWLAPGVRGSYHRLNQRDYGFPEPRLSLRYQLSEPWTLTAFAGYFTQSPPTDKYADGIGVPETGIIQAAQGSVGIEGRWSSGIEANATAYYTEMNNLVIKDTVATVSRPTEWESDTAYLQFVPSYRPVRGRSFGLETQLRMRPRGDTFGWVSLTLGRSLRYDDGEVFPSGYDVPISFVAVGSHHIGRDWNLSGRLRLASGQPYTPQYGAFSTVEDLYFPIPGERNSERFPFYKQVDVRIDKTWTAKRARWTWYLDVYNALNQKIPLEATYTWNFTELDIRYGIPILPTTGIEVQY